MTTIAFLPVADGYGFLRSVWQNVVRSRRQRRNKERQNEGRFRVSGNIRFVFFVKISSEEVINGLPKRYALCAMCEAKCMISCSHPSILLKHLDHG